MSPGGPLLAADSGSFSQGASSTADWPSDVGGAVVVSTLSGYIVSLLVTLTLTTEGDKKERTSLVIAGKCYTQKKLWLLVW